MAAITALNFDTEDGADNAFDAVQNLVKQRLLTLHDAAIVTWSMGKEKPKTRQVTNLAATGALDDSFWGVFLGIIFSAPLLGTDTGLAGSLTDAGIDDDFIKSVREKVVNGTSALFLITGNGVLDRVPEAMQDMDFELVSSRLSREQEAQLKTAFSDSN